jgi:ABC-type Fe3+-hydroxamate transport system substrate-binding protein
MVCKDQLNRTLLFPNPPKRIISLVPSQTELLVDLGLEKFIVGVTKFCVHPKEIRENVALVGGTKKIHLEKIKALQPDIIICNKEENTKEIVDQLMNVAPVWVSDIYNIEDNFEMIHLLGKLFDVSKEADTLISRISSEKKDFEAFLKTKPQYKVAYLIWNNPYMMAGNQTFINSLLALNHFKNIADKSESRYPEVSIHDLKNADKILLSSEPFPFKEKHIQELQKATGKEVILVDGEYFSWSGSRLQKAFSYFKTLH